MYDAGFQAMELRGPYDVANLYPLPQPTAISPSLMFHSCHLWRSSYILYKDLHYFVSLRWTDLDLDTLQILLLGFIGQIII